MTSRQIAIKAMTAGLIAGAVCLGFVTLFNIGAADFKHALFMARDLLAAKDPYAHEPGPYWVPYPLPAAFLGLLFAPLPDTFAAGAFLAVSVGLLVYGILKKGEPWRLAMLFSWPTVYALIFAQWSPLLCAMWFLPWLGPLVLVKPNIALPMLISGWPRWRTISAGAVILAVSLILRPDWPWVWIHQVGAYQGITPPLLLMPLGPLILLSLIGWRDRTAWLTLGMAVMPQRVFYDQLALLLVAQNPSEMLWLTATSWISFLVLWASPDMPHMPGGWSLWVVAGHYLPAVALIVRRALRDPATLASLPAWLPVPRTESKSQV